MKQSLQKRKIEMNLKFLPEEIELEIIERLPVKSLLRFKSVCKRWHSLIGASSFIKRYNHLSMSRRKLLCYGKAPIIKPCARVIDHQTTETIEDLEFPPFIDRAWALEGIDIYRFNLYVRFDFKIDDIHILGPVKGMYCIFHRLVERHGGTLILWNPATRSYKHILPPVSFPFPLHEQRFFARYVEEEKRALGLHIGFGYDDTIHDHKVVVICHWQGMYSFTGDEHWQVRAYNNATSSWSTICYLEYVCDTDLAFPYIRSEPEFCNCFINGNCHWSCAKRGEDGGCCDVSEYVVLAFDMVRHTFRFMHGPPIHDLLLSVEPSVWVLRGTIDMVVTSPKEKDVKVWIMREYGVEDSWDLFCSIPIKPEFKVVGIPNDEGIVLGDKHGQLISYRFDDYDEDVKHGVPIKPLDSYEGTLRVFNYVETLAGLHPVMPSDRQH